MRFQTENGVLIAQANGETLRIEPWGKDSLRVHVSGQMGFPRLGLAAGQLCWPWAG